MQKVYMPADFARTFLFGSETKTDEGGKFLMLNEECAPIAVKDHGGVIAPEPAAEPEPAAAAGAPAGGAAK